MLISPTFLYTMSDFSRFAALFACYRLQSAHFHLLISKDAFAIIAPQILLAHRSYYDALLRTQTPRIFCNIIY